MRGYGTALVAFAAIALAGVARGAVVSYTGIDAGAGVGSGHSNSDSAAANLNADITGLGLSSGSINFESAPVGQFTALAVGSGVTISGSDANGNHQTIMSAPSGNPSALYGFNTTPGGSNYVDLYGGSLTFTFAQQVEAFGAYLTGVQPFTAESITFTDGTSQSITIPTSNSGGVAYAGFTDVGASIASVTITTPVDIVGVDDVTYGFEAPAGVAPLPSTAYAGLGLLGGLGCWMVARRRKVIAG